MSAFPFVKIKEHNIFVSRSHYDFKPVDGKDGSLSLRVQCSIASSALKAFN